MIRHDYAGKPFIAYDGTQRPYILTPLYRLKPNSSGGWDADPDPVYCVGLRSDDSRFGERLSRGRYRLLDDGTELTSSDPDAV